MVSRERYLLERLTDTQLALLGDGKILDLSVSGDKLAGMPMAAGSTDGTTSAGSASACPAPEEPR